MPTFYAKSTTVQLSVANLEHTTTANIRTAQSPQTTEIIRDIAFEFAKGSKDGSLSEIAINGEDGHHVQFLGKLENMPFFMVRAGKDFFDLNGSERRNRRPARVPLFETKNGFVLIDSSNKGRPPFMRKILGRLVDIGLENTSKLKIASIEPNRKHTAEQKPHALCLTICLSSASFVKTKASRGNGTFTSDIKLDVFFNGQFCASDFVPHRYCGDASYGMTEHIVRFTGQRLGRIVEKPWVLVPPDQGPDGGKRNATAPVDAAQRWKAISDALLFEADMAGRNKDGERSITGDYLESLASLPMPVEAGDMQHEGHANFGVIDVIVIYGQGSKDGPEKLYLSKPTPMKIDGYKFFREEQPALQPSIPEVATPASNAQTLQEIAEALAMAKALDEWEESNLEPTKATTATRNRITRSQASSNGNQVNHSTPPTKPLLPPPAPDGPKKRSASPTTQAIPPPAPKRARISSASTLTSVELPHRGSRASSIVTNTDIDPPPKHPKIQSMNLPVRRSRTPSTSKSTATATCVKIPIPQPPNRSRYQAMPYHDVWTNKQTLAEEMEAIAQQAAEDTEAGFWPLQRSIPRATRASLMEVEAEVEGEGVEVEVGSPALSEAPPGESSLEVGDTKKLSKVVTLKYSSPEKSGSSSPSKANTTMGASGSLSPMKPPTTIPMNTPLTTRRKTLNSIGEGAASTPVKALAQNRRRNRKQDSQPSAEVLEAGFTVPELSRDCVVTYAEKDVLRNVGAVRGGSFVEGGVLMGVRFLVG